ncbi:GTPase IMAP family member 4 [Naviculisporaceae sp. PSN 640]
MSSRPLRQLTWRKDPVAQQKLRPIMVMIVGLTGAGKTTFTRLASGRTDLEVGDGLDSCTQDPEAVRFDLDGRTIVLIDTPGFDDTNRNDVDILEHIAKWLAKQGFSKRQPLDGMILLHPITDFHFDSSLEKRRTRILQKILGKNAYKRVVVATTMWEFLVKDMESEVDKEISRRWSQRGGVWDEFRQGGAHLTKHFNTPASAERILRIIIRASEEAERASILIQEELAKRNMKFTETTLGEELTSLLDHDIKFITDLLLDHRKQRPPDWYQSSSNEDWRNEWERWHAENQDLKRVLEQLNKQRRGLNSIFIWSRLFR